MACHKDLREGICVASQHASQDNTKNGRLYTLPIKPLFSPARLQRNKSYSGGSVACADCDQESRVAISFDRFFPYLLISNGIGEGINTPTRPANSWCNFLLTFSYLLIICYPHIPWPRTMIYNIQKTKTQPRPSLLTATLALEMLC